MQTRKAQPEDSQKIEDLVAACVGDEFRPLTRAYLKSMFSNDYRKPTFMVGVEEGQVVALAAFSEELFTIEVWGISFVCVVPEKQNQGLGQKIVEACIDEISKRVEKPATAILNTMPGKTRLYEKCGFEVGGEDHAKGFFMMKTVEPNRG